MAQIEAGGAGRSAGIAVELTWSSDTRRRPQHAIEQVPRDLASVRSAQGIVHSSGMTAGIKAGTCCGEQKA